jgi:hypothetical protein
MNAVKHLLTAENVATTVDLPSKVSDIIDRVSPLAVAAQATGNDIEETWILLLTKLRPTVR